MRKYETIVITKPEVKDAYIGALKKKVEKVLSAKPGNILKKDDWGLKKLAYPIQHEKKGRYLFWSYEQDGDALMGLDRILRFDEEILRYLSIRVDEEKVEEEAPKASKFTKKAKEAPADDESDGESRDYTFKVDYKEPATLVRYMTDRGKILPQRQVRLTATQQRKVAKAIKRARQLALLSYTDGFSAVSEGGAR